jgi:pimeloyl-ACP methyl ester carboxylesterase
MKQVAQATCFIILQSRTMIHYNKFGINTPTLVLIHGFPSDSSVWNKVIPHIEDDISGIAIDMPGVGKSAPLQDLTLPKIAMAIQEVIAHEKMQNVHLVGHSMGGYTALELAQQLGDKTKAISLVHSGANSDSDDKKKFREKSIQLIRKGEKEKEVFVQAMFKNFFSEQFTNEHPEIIKEYIDKGNNIPASTIADLYHAIKIRTSSIDFLSHTKIPIQFILGTEDNATPLKDLLPQTALPNVCKVNIYETCGHGSFEEYPERLANDLKKFHEFSF